jgi:hypothetical protein
MRPSICIAAACLALAGCSSTPETPPISNYLMGEKVALGKLSYTVFETQWLTHLGDPATGRIPQNRFFLIRFSVTNSASEDVTIINPTLTDDHGNVHDELSNGEGVPQWAGYLRVAKPADTIQGNIVFDVAPGHYKLKLPDETGTRFAMIDLPLNYHSETPEFVDPAPKKAPDFGTGAKK